MSVPLLLGPPHALLPVVLPEPLVAPEVELLVPVVPDPLLPAPIEPPEPVSDVLLPVVASLGELALPLVEPDGLVLPMPDEPEVPDVAPVPVVPDVPDASVAPLALVPPVPDDPLVLPEPVVPLLPPVAPDVPAPLPVVPPLMVLPVPLDVPVAAGLSELMLPPCMVRSDVVDDVEPLCASVAVLTPSNETRTAIGSFFMLPPDNVTN